MAMPHTAPNEGIPVFMMQRGGVKLGLGTRILAERLIFWIVI